MLTPASTIKAFGAYAMGTGIALMLAPHLLLGLFGLAPPQEIWIRVLGALALVLGVYYWAMGVAGAQAFFRASIWGRLLFCALCAALVVGAQAPWILLLFGAVDVAGAVWTAWALRADVATQGRR